MKKSCTECLRYQKNNNHSLPKFKQVEDNIYGSESEMERLQFTADLNRKLQICYFATNHSFMTMNMQRRIQAY